MKPRSRITMTSINFTKEGFEKLKKQEEELVAQRPDAVMHLKRAREMGDLSENGYYKASRAKLSWIDGQLTRVRYYLKMAKIVEETEKETIDIGSNVILSDGNSETAYKIVGDLEANPREGKISLLSPIGKAISGKRKGDQIEISTPAGIKKYKIL